MKKTLLIVEDDPFTRQFYSYLFPKNDYELIQTEDGNEAMEALEKRNISLIIMDISLRIHLLMKRNLTDWNYPV